MAEPFRLKEELSLDPTAFVAPGASVAGRVTLRARSSVWFSAVIRADMDRAELGEESNLQDGSVVHVDEGFPAIIGRRVTVGHRAIVHGATVEDESLVGMGAILLNGAHIGRGSLIAAGSLVREGQKIPPASLVVGSPARVIGPVRPEHTEAIRRGVDHYVEFAASYRARGYAAAFPAGPAGVVQAAIGRGDEIEWSHGLEQLELTPARIAQDLEGLDSSVIVLRPDEDKWSALDVLCHLRDVERDVYAERLRQLLEARVDEVPLLAGEADMNRRNARLRAERRYDREDPAQVLAAFAAARGENVGRLAGLSPADWRRAGIHPSRGPVTLFEQVRRSLAHDLSHLRQMERALDDAGA